MKAFDESMACKPEFFTKALSGKNVDASIVKLSNTGMFSR
jgi:hypothetical protein